MRVDQSGLDFIKEHEGVRQKVYLDAVGKPTVGVGHLVLPQDNLKVGDVITNERVDQLLRQDIKIAEDAVSALVTVPLNQNQFNALVSLVFNIGTGNFQKSSLLRQINREQFLNAANGFLAWNKGRVKGVLTVLRGLTRRRQAERQLFLTPVS